MKVAICVSGESFKFEKGYYWLKQNYLDKYDCDFYIHTWDNSNNINKILELYQPKDYYYQSLIPFDDNNEYLNDILNEAYSTHACYNLVRDSKTDYDLIIHIKFNTFPSFDGTEYDKFAICSPPVSEHYADCFSFILYYTFVDENYKEWILDRDWETRESIKFYMNY